jgi:hypothetical protein
MGWNEVDDKMKKHVDASFVACSEGYEKHTIKRILKEEFPLLSEATITQAIEGCCREIPAPRPRDRYIACLRRKLGG